MQNNSMKQLLMSSNYFVLNKQIVKELGIETAFLLTTLIEASDGLSDENGWFYQTSDKLEELTGLSNHKQTKYINKLIELEILEQENRGTPCRRFFKISFEKIENLVFKKFENYSLKNSKTSFENSLKHNKEYNINNLNKELNNKSAGEPAHEPEEEIEINAEEFAKDIKELRDIAVNSTGQDRFYVENLINPYKYKGIIKKLLIKIKSSDFLMGRKEQKPKLIIFTRESKINEILTGAYDNYDERPKTREKPYLPQKTRQELEFLF